MSRPNERASWMRRGGAILLVLMLLGALSRGAAACPNCGLDVVEEQGGGEELKEGFTYSIVGLASMPFLVAAVAGGLILRAYRGRGGNDDDDRQ